MSYSQRILQQGSLLTRLAHRSRFGTVLDTIRDAQYTQALDSGCGDGWLLKMAYEQNLIKQGFGVDIHPVMLSTCQELFSDIPGFQFCHPQEAAAKIPPKSCDLILCTETLEHVEEPEEILQQMLTYSKPGAKMVISVPIEIGPSLLFKQVGRYLANRKGTYGYERYRLNELFAASILWDADSFPSSHSLKASLRHHKGFDYRKIDKLLRQKLTIERIIPSPFPWLGSLLNSTIIWICSVEN
ncbi:MAG: class I SAM-dependent methyltransferase [Coleofasciculus sp. S288]|nr:class I SAM-dependent methyltransferase [Coleofasciculus sp. S288]